MKNKKLKILLAAPRGFCAGVDRAIEIVKKSINKFGPPVYVRHEIVHNKYVVDSLKKIGAIFVEKLDEVKDKTRPVIFSAHGVPKSVPEKAKNLNMENIDATCSQLLSEISDQCVVISPIVPMTKTDVGFECIAIKDNKAFSHQTVEKHMKDKTKLVSAFHVISEKKLVNPTISLDYDIFVAGDDKDSVEVVNGLINEIEGLRPIYLGPGVLSYLVEMSTPLLLNAMIRNKMKNPGIKLV